MYKTCHPFLFTVICVVGVSCAPHGASIDVLPSTNPSAEELQDNQCSHEQDQDCNMTVHEKQRILLLEQDYQGALDLMPQLEKELLEKAMLAGEPPYEALGTIRLGYSYLYVALGREKEALQKIMEIELLIEDAPDLELIDFVDKIIVMQRLNRVDEIIDEINRILNDSRIRPVLPVDYALMMGILIATQIMKGDM